MKTITLALTALTLLLCVGFTEFSNGLSPLQQLFVIKEVKPDIARVGVIISERAATADVLKKINQASAATQVQVFVAKVSGMPDVGPMLRDLTNSQNVEMIWILDDDDVTGNKMSQSYIIKNATKSGLPIVAPTPDWVSNGATISFLKTADGVQLSVNQATAKAMSIEVPEKYLASTNFLAVN